MSYASSNSGSDYSKNFDTSGPSGHSEEYWEEDPAVVAQIDQNNADIASYQSVIDNLTSLKNVAGECKSNLDCCYSNITLAVTLDADPINNAKNFSNINEYAQTMDKQAIAMTNQMEELNDKIKALEAQNAELEKVRMVKSIRWVLD